MSHLLDSHLGHWLQDDLLLVLDHLCVDPKHGLVVGDVVVVVVRLSFVPLLVESIEAEHGSECQVHGKWQYVVDLGYDVQCELCRDLHLLVVVVYILGPPLLVEELGQVGVAIQLSVHFHGSVYPGP